MTESLLKLKEDIVSKIRSWEDAAVTDAMGVSQLNEMCKDLKRIELLKLGILICAEMEEEAGSAAMMVFRKSDLFKVVETCVPYFARMQESFKKILETIDEVSSMSLFAQSEGDGSGAVKFQRVLLADVMSETSFLEFIGGDFKYLSDEDCYKTFYFGDVNVPFVEVVRCINETLKPMTVSLEDKIELAGNVVKKMAASPEILELIKSRWLLKASDIYQFKLFDRARRGFVDEYIANVKEILFFLQNGENDKVENALKLLKDSEDAVPEILKAQALVHGGILKLMAEEGPVDIGFINEILARSGFTEANEAIKISYRNFVLQDCLATGGRGKEKLRQIGEMLGVDELDTVFSMLDERLKCNQVLKLFDNFLTNIKSDEEFLSDVPAILAEVRSPESRVFLKEKIFYFLIARMQNMLYEKDELKKIFINLHESEIFPLEDFAQYLNSAIDITKAIDPLLQYNLTLNINRLAVTPIVRDVSLVRTELVVVSGMVAKKLTNDFDRQFLDAVASDIENKVSLYTYLQNKAKMKEAYTTMLPGFIEQLQTTINPARKEFFLKELVADITKPTRVLEKKYSLSEEVWSELLRTASSVGIIDSESLTKALEESNLVTNNVATFTNLKNLISAKVDGITFFSPAQKSRIIERNRAVTLAIEAENKASVINVMLDKMMKKSKFLKDINVSDCITYDYNKGLCSCVENDFLLLTPYNITKAAVVELVISSLNLMLCEHDSKWEMPQRDLNNLKKFVGVDGELMIEEKKYEEAAKRVDEVLKMSMNPPRANASMLFNYFAGGDQLPDAEFEKFMAQLAQSDGGRINHEFPIVCVREFLASGEIKLHELNRILARAADLGINAEITPSFVQSVLEGQYDIPVNFKQVEDLTKKFPSIETKSIQAALNRRQSLNSALHTASRRLRWPAEIFDAELFTFVNDEYTATKDDTPFSIGGATLTRSDIAQVFFNVLHRGAPGFKEDRGLKAEDPAEQIKKTFTLIKSVKTLEDKLLRGIEAKKTKKQTSAKVSKPRAEAAAGGAGAARGAY